MEQDAKHSITYFYYVKVCSVFFVLTKNILFQPFCLILLAATRCSLTNDEGSIVTLGYECKGQVHIVLIALSIFVLVLDFLTGLLVVWLFSDDQPDSDLPWAHCQRSFDICRYTQKFILPIMIFIDVPSESITAIEFLGLFILCAICVYQLYRQTYMNNRFVFYALLVSELAKLWLCLIILLNMLLDIDWSNPIMYALFIVLSLAAVFFTNENRLEEILQTQEVESLRQMNEVETYARILMAKVADDSSESRSFIEETLMIHSIKCENSHCVCRRFGNQSKMTDSNAVLENEDEEMEEPRKAETGKEGGGTCLESAETGKKRNYLCRLMISDISAWGDRHDKEPRFHIYLAALKLSCYENPLTALLQLMYASDTSPDLYDEFMIYRLM